MKKSICLLLCIAMLLLCSCSREYSVEGYKNFSIHHSDYELNHYILPSDDFVETFQHTKIDYYYREEYSSIVDFASRTFVVINYEKDVYEQAKEYCLENMQLSESVYIEYNGYTFIENIELAVKQERYGEISFPRWFNMFVYNDDLNTLIFIGFYGTEYSNEDAQDIQNNWGAFLEKHFSDLYDWK